MPENNCVVCGGVGKVSRPLVSDGTYYVLEWLDCPVCGNSKERVAMEQQNIKPVFHCGKCGYAGPDPLFHWFQCSNFGKALYSFYIWAHEAVIDWISFRSLLIGITFGFSLGIATWFAKNNQKIFNESFFYLLPTVLGLTSFILILGGLKPFLNQETWKDAPKQWKAQVSLGLIVLLAALCLHDFIKYFHPEIFQDLHSYLLLHNK